MVRYGLATVWRGFDSHDGTFHTVMAWSRPFAMAQSLGVDNMQAERRVPCLSRRVFSWTEGRCDMTVSVQVDTDALWSELERMAAFRDCLTNQEFLAWLESTMPKEDE